MKSLSKILKNAAVFSAVFLVALQVSAQSFTTLGSYIVTSGLSNSTGRIGVGTNFPGGIFETRGEGSVEQGAWRGFYYANVAEGSRMNWVRGRGTSAAPTSLINGDLIGSFNAYGYTSVNYAEVQNPAVFRFRVDGAVSANVLPTKFEIMTGTSTTARATRFEISSAGAVKLNGLAGTGTRMVTADLNGTLGTAAVPVSSQWVTSGSTISYATGNVGIGTTTAPAQKLTVQTAANSQGIAHTDGTITVGTWVANNYGWLGTYSANNLAFGTGSSYPQMMLANGTGNLGIGTSYTVAPAYRLTVQTPTNSFGAVHTDGTVQVGTFAGTKTNLIGGFGTKTAHPLGFFTKNQTPAIYMDTLSRVGVGTLSPTATLHAYNVNDSIYYVPATNNGGFFFPGYTTGGVVKVTGNNGTLLFDGNEIQSDFGGLFFGSNNTVSLQRRGGSLLVGATYNTENAKFAVLSENNSATTPIATFTANNKTAGVGLWYGGIRAVGTNGNNSLTLEPQAGGYVNIPGNSTLGTNPLLNVYEQDNDYARIQLGNSNAGDYFHIASYISSSSYYGDQTRFYHSAAGDIMTVQGGPSAGTGRVGIGTTAPAYTLDVCGTIRGKEVRVETGWCDYVFEPSFKLRPLEEVKSYIAAHKHLPDVTPALEIEQNGLQVGAVMKQQMLKIEELTLYTLQQDEALKAANAKITAQEALLQDLAKRLEALEKK